jgi:hypothetical protein
MLIKLKKGQSKKYFLLLYLNQHGIKGLNHYEELVFRARHTCTLRPNVFAMDFGYRYPFKNKEWIQFILGCPDELRFDKELMDMGIKCFLADFSIKKSPLPNVKFLKKFVASFDDDKHININRWIDENIHNCDGDAILQMDIEGQEYEVINALDDEKLKKFRILVIEFHKLHQLFDKSTFNTINNSFIKLLKNYRVLHIHPNNTSTILSVKNIDVPNTMEFTFLRNDRIKKKSKRNNFPHKIDHKNVDRADVILPECWYS